MTTLTKRQARMLGQAAQHGAVAPPPEKAERPPTVQYIALDQIRTDGGTQARAGLNPEAVADYTEAWRSLSHQQNGFLQMPPIVVYYDGTDYWLADGFHRVEAYTCFVNGRDASASPRGLQAEVRQGTRRDAVLYACGANDQHGLRRSTADKERAVLSLLDDEEWSQWSDREIARRCKVSHEFVGAVAERNNVTGRASSERKTADGRTMDVSGIAAANRERAQPTDDQIAQMRQRFYAQGYEQFYSSDAGWTAYHPRTKKANYKTWAAVEADITRKEAMAAPRLCDRCGKNWGKPGSMIVGAEKLCQDCAAARLSSGQPFAPAASATDRPDGSPAGGWPSDFDDVQRRFAALGTTLTYDHHRGFIMREDRSGAGRVNPNWVTVVEHLETRERGRAALAAAPDGRVPQYPDKQAIAARLARHNWHIQSHFGHEGTIWLVRTGKQGGQKNVRDWAAVVAFADQLDGVTTPTPVAPFDPTPAPCEDCGAPSTNKRTIGGVFAHRCDVCAIKASDQELADLRAAAQVDPKWTALCEAAEQLGAQINYLATSDPNTAEVTPPVGYPQRPQICDADELARLIQQWQPGAAPAPTWDIGPDRTHAAKVIKAHISTLPDAVVRLLLLALAQTADEKRGVLTFHRSLLDSAVTGALVGAGARLDRDAALLAQLLA